MLFVTCIYQIYQINVGYAFTIKLVNKSNNATVPKKKNATNKANQIIPNGLISNLPSSFLPTPSTALIACFIKRKVG